MDASDDLDVATDVATRRHGRRVAVVENAGRPVALHAPDTAIPKSDSRRRGALPVARDKSRPDYCGSLTVRERGGPRRVALGRLLLVRCERERHACRDACFTHRKRASAEGRLSARSSGGRSSFAVVRELFLRVSRAHGGDAAPAWTSPDS